MSIISWRVRLLWWNHDPYLMEADWFHLTPLTTPLTSPTKSFTETGIYGPRHISTSRITHHLIPKQSDVLQELNRYWFVTEQVHQKTSARSTVIPQHRTSVRKPGHVGTPSEPFLASFLYLLDASLEELPLKYLPPLSLCFSLLVIIHLIRHPHIYVFIYINIWNIQISSYWNIVRNRIWKS